MECSYSISTKNSWRNKSCWDNRRIKRNFHQTWYWNWEISASWNYIRKFNRSSNNKYHFELKRGKKHVNSWSSVNNNWLESFNQLNRNLSFLRGIKYWWREKNWGRKKNWSRKTKSSYYKTLWRKRC